MICPQLQSMPRRFLTMGYRGPLSESVDGMKIFIVLLAVGMRTEDDEDQITVVIFFSACNCSSDG